MTTGIGGAEMMKMSEIIIFQTEDVVLTFICGMILGAAIFLIVDTLMDHTIKKVVNRIVKRR
jgi:hypothetical protein